MSRFAQVRNISLAIAVGGALAACGSDETKVYESEDGTASVTVNDDGEYESRIETNEGTAAFRTGDKVEVALPDGIAPYPGAEIVSNSTFESAAGQGGMVMMQSDDAPEKVMAYYRKQFEAADVSIKTTMETGGTYMLAGEKPDGTSVSMNASGSAGDTSVVLTIGMGLGR